MTREQAINYLESSGMTDEQIAEIVTAIERTETHSCDCDRKETHGDVIYRQAAIDELDTVGYDFSESGFSEVELIEVCEAVGYVRQDMISRIKKMPSAQSEIIRCKDCSKRYDEEGECPMLFIESVTYDDDGYIEVDDIFHDNTEDEGFCDRGERRTNE